MKASVTPVNVLIILLSTALLVDCTSNKEVKIDYLGQKPPGMNAEVFAPNVISTKLNEHSSLAFSPDGDVVLWSVMNKKYRGALFEMKYENGLWSNPSTPSFADTLTDYYCPSFSTDGKTLFFSSRRTAPEGYPVGRGNRIWSVERTNKGWGTPTPIDSSVSKAQEFSHSVARNGTLYFSSAVNNGTNLNIFKAEASRTGYLKAVALPYSINSIGYEDGPYIAPDEDFMIFESTRPEGIDGSHDLYISFRSGDGSWGVPLNMGRKINSGSMERFPRLSPDGKYLFFGSNRDQTDGKVGFDIYWIDARVIDELRNEATTEIIEQRLGYEIINALFENDTDDSATLLKQWLVRHPNSLDATIVYSAMLRKQKKYSEAEQLLENITPGLNSNTSVVMEKALVQFGLNKEDTANIILSPLLSERPDQRELFMYLSNSLLDMGNYEVSDEYFEKAMALGSNQYEYLRRARKYALAKEGEKAFENLSKAIDLGYDSRQQLESDGELQFLKSDARWTELLKNLK